MPNMNRWIIGAAGAAACSFGIWQAVHIGMGRTLAGNGVFTNDITATGRGVRLLSDDAATHTAHGIVLQRTGNYPDGCRELERAVQLRPRDYFLWMLLGVTRDLNGDQAGALRALHQSIARAPAYAKPHWLLGNLLLRTGQTDEAFQELRFASAGDQTLLPNVIDLAWGMTGNNPVRTVAVVQPQTDVARMALATFFASHKQVVPAIEQFRATSGHSDNSSLNNLLGELLKSRLFTEAYEVWTHIHGVPAGESALLNPSFEDEIVIGETGFGWQISSDVPNTTMSIDTSQHQSGSRSFRIDFHGDSSSVSPLLSQVSLVNPNTKYRLKFQGLSKDLVSASPPIVIVSDASDEKQQVLGQSPTFIGANAWREFMVEFTTGANTRAITLTLARQACPNQPCAAFGTVWLDSFRLQSEK